MAGFGMQVLCCFDTDGVGSVNYAQGGNPWLVTTKAGWMLCSKEGRIEQRGSWPRTAKEPIICQLTPELTVTFVDQQHIQAAFSCADVDRLFQVGEYLRRSEGIAALGTDAQGRLQLDIPAIRQRISTVGSLYTPPGPHHSVTPQPGLGNLRSIVSKMDPASELRATISALDKGQARIAGLTTLKHTYGSRSSSRSSSRPGSSAPATAAAAAAAAGDADTADAEQDAPYGSPVLTPAQQKLAAKLKRAEVAKPNYTIRRKKLPLLSVAQLDALLGPAGPQDVLIAVCVLASWNPVCTKLEHYQLQAAAYELQQQAAAAKHVHGGGGGALQHGSSRDGSGSSCSSSVALGADAAYIQMYKVDGSESRELQQRYGFRSIPMFLLFYGGRLVSAGNSMRSADELLAAAAAGLAAGRRRDFLPEGFRFGAGGDNAMLDSITKDMSLLG
uniref:FAM194 C-terminal domain-containing protein n=1 Tax=Tetradesmus obliquus TaxID=3088 RepID=A0A383VAF3_TETOB|eukprot:jgi/Sobl393_1/3611/SZX61923.1